MGFSKQTFPGFNGLSILPAAFLTVGEEVDSFEEDRSGPLLDSGSIARKGFLKEIL